MNHRDNPPANPRPSDDLPPSQASLDLLALAQGGDRAALDDLLGHYQDRLRRIVRTQLGGSMMRRHYDSMDIVQSTFKAALPKIADLHPKSPAGLLNWLAVIATNQIRDAYNNLKAAKRDVHRQVVLSDDARACLAAGDPFPDEQAVLAEVREMLDQQMTHLPCDQRRVVLLRDYMGADWDRIAAELNRESGAARQLHQRAWIRLRSALRPRLADPN